MNQIQVGVIIPVYNAASFVQKAVESALIQPQTSEVILVEDGSPDNSWDVCQRLAAKYDKVCLYRMPYGRNHGSSATRNVAIRHCTCEYVAFLDADDFYLPGRFDEVEKLFTTDPLLEGTYDAIGMYVENEAGLQRWKDARRAEAPLTTMKKRVPPDSLFDALVSGGSGLFSIVGMVVKRSIFEKTGYFDENLHMHEDDAFKFKAAAVGRLAPGKLDEPVAMRRVHDHNRISAPRPNHLIYKNRLLLWSTLWNWSQRHLDRRKQQIILRAMIKEVTHLTRFDRQSPPRLSTIQKCVQLLMLPFDYPFVLKEQLFWHAFLQLVPPIRRA